MLRKFFDNSSSTLSRLNIEQYRESFSNGSIRKAAFEKAWDARKFEIELYWKRATYFWAFIATTFIGYFALVNSENYKAVDDYQHAEVYFVICIGFVLSCAWLFINKGSKAWQQNWEIHVDLLEDEVVGPLYKTVWANKTFSVSKINEIVSSVFIGIWILLALKFLVDQDLLHLNPLGVNPFVVCSTLLAFGSVWAMLFGYGRGRFSDERVVMFRRTTNYESTRSEQI